MLFGNTSTKMILRNINFTKSFLSVRKQLFKNRVTKFEFLYRDFFLQNRAFNIFGNWNFQKAKTTPLFHCDGLCQIARFVGIVSSEHGAIVGEKLSRNHCKKWREGRADFWNRDNVIGGV